jgi:hypothetical protein
MLTDGVLGGACVGRLVRMWGVPVALVLALLVCQLESGLVDTGLVVPEGSTWLTGEFRRMDIGDGAIDYCAALGGEWGVEPGELMALCMLSNDYSMTVEGLGAMEQGMVRRCLRRLYLQWNDEFAELAKVCTALLKDSEGSVFPVPMSSNERVKWVEYIDSWGYERTYGGERSHEGTDIFAIDNVRGRLPVVSMTDGTVSAKGWLELGGYRLGITSGNGVYYYYAHLDSYAEGLEVGDEVHAGQLIGLMGDSGYSRVPGTKGYFPVHLHLGMYIYRDGMELSINPHGWLRASEGQMRIYDYY